MSGELAGTLRERIAITGARTRDAAGAATGDPVVGDAVWASVAAVRAVAGEDAGRTAAPQRYRIVMRDAASAPKVGSSLRWRGQTLSVLTVARDPLRPGIVELMAEAR